MDQVTEQLLSSTDAVRMEPGLLTPLPWPGWKARIRSLQVDGVRADYVEYDPYRFEVPSLADRPEGPVRMMLVVVLSGSTIGSVDEYPLSLAPKQAVLIDGRAAMHFHAPEPLRAVRLFVDEQLLPPDVLERRKLPYALLKDSPLVAGCVGLITGLLQVGNPIVESRDAPAVGKPLVALQAALLDEALHEPRVEVRSKRRPGNRERIEALVLARLTDRTLSIGSIAADLGLSVRTAHAAFDGSGDTIASFIRSRRVERAQTLLALRRDRPQVGALAARVGMSPEQFTRAFRALTGVTATEWWQEHRAPDAPPAVRDRAGAG